MDFSSWLDLSNKDLWQYALDAQRTMKCIAFGSTLKQVFRDMGMEILTAHKNLQFYGNLENSLRLFPRTNSISLNPPMNNPALTLEDGMIKDVEDYFNMFERICAQNQPSWQRRRIALPPDVSYFREVYAEFRNPMGTTYDELRRREFWVFNYPGFLSLGLQENFFYLVFDLKTQHEDIFDSVITLNVGPNPNVFQHWQNETNRDPHQYFESVYTYNHWNAPPQNPAAGTRHRNCPRIPPRRNTRLINPNYHNRLGVVNFVRNLHHHFRDLSDPIRGNRIQLAQKIQSIYPDLMGMLHLEFCRTYDEWDPSLFEFLIAEEVRARRIYTWG